MNVPGCALQNTVSKSVPRWASWSLVAFCCASWFRLFAGTCLHEGQALFWLTFLLSAVGATDNTTCKGAPRWAPCSARVVRCLSAGPFAGKSALAAAKVGVSASACFCVSQTKRRTTQLSRAFLGGPLEVFALCGCSWRARFGVLQGTDVSRHACTLVR